MWPKFFIPGILGSRESLGVFEIPKVLEGSGRTRMSENYTWIMAGAIATAMTGDSANYVDTPIPATTLRVSPEIGFCRV